MYLQGVCSSLIGPTLPDLGKNVNAELDSLSSIFLGCFVGGIGGALLAGIIPSHVNRCLVISIGLGLLSLGIILIPWIHDVTVLACLFAVAMCGFNLTDTGRWKLCLNG